MIFASLALAVGCAPIILMTRHLPGVLARTAFAVCLAVVLYPPVEGFLWQVVASPRASRFRPHKHFLEPANTAVFILPAFVISVAAGLAVVVLAPSI
jgi:hypothetical protein